MDKSMRNERLANATEFDLAAVIDRFQSPLLRYVGQLLGPDTGEAEEVVQDTFIRLHRQVTRDGVHSIENLPGWLFRVAHNLARDAGRKRRRKKKLRKALMADPTVQTVGTSDALPPGTDMARREAYTIVIRELHRLSRADQELLLLKIIQNLTLREISEITGVGLSTLHYRLNRALTQLSQRLTDIGLV